MKFFLFAASPSKNSLNRKLTSIMENELKKMGHEVDHANMNEFALPLYCIDLQNEQGIPDTVHTFVSRMHAADKVIFSSPEYNSSIPGPFKNLIDWVSRIKPMPWKNQDILLTSASPSIYGGARGLLSLRVPLDGCGSFTFPQTYSLPKANEAFDEDGQLIDPKRMESLSSLLDSFAKTHITREA